MFFPLCCSSNSAFIESSTINLDLGIGQKQVYLVRLGPKMGTFLNQVKNAPLERCYCPKRIVPIFGRLNPTYARVCLPCLTFNCVFVIFSQSVAVRSSCVVEPASISGAADARPSVVMVQIGIRTYVLYVYLRGRVLADTCVARMAWCGVWRVEGVSPYVGTRMGGIRRRMEILRASDWLKKLQKTVESQAE